MSLHIAFKEILYILPIINSGHYFALIHDFRNYGVDEILVV